MVFQVLIHHFIVYFLLISSCFLCMLLNWHVIDLQYRVSFRCMTYWFDNSKLYKMISTIGLVTICCHTNYCNIIDSISYAVHYMLWHLFYVLKFVPHNLPPASPIFPILFLSGPTSCSLYLYSINLCFVIIWTVFACLFQMLHISDHIEYLSSSVWFISLSISSKISFFLWILFPCMKTPVVSLSTHLLMDTEVVSTSWLFYNRYEFWTV